MQASKETLLTLGRAGWRGYPFAGAVRARVFPPLVGPSAAYAGPGYIAGTVTVEGVPAARPVRVYERGSGTFVAEGRSAADGTYRLDGLALGVDYTVLALDETNIHNAVVADRIQAVT